ncbi:MAG TPA: M1 family aminopeptidase [Bryobacteraceae bacterium]|nr:M1 family aminopeptidase [Bryobacteraceae bacterium]
MLLALLFATQLTLRAGPADDLARTIREVGLDRNECYRVRDLTLTKEDIRIYLSDGYLIFSKPVAGQPIAAVFTTDVQNGDGEVLLLPPNLAERRSLAGYIGAPNLDDHFQTAAFFFTGDVYHELLNQLPNNPTNKKAPEMGALLDEKWSPALRNIAASYDTRLTLDLLNRAAHKPDLLSAIIESPKLGNFDVVYDPDNADQIAAGQLVQRDNRAYFDVWTHFRSRSARGGRAPERLQWEMNEYRIQATVNPDLTLDAVTRVKVKSPAEGMLALPFEITRAMTISEVTVDGRPAEVLQKDALRANAGRENALFVVTPPEPLHAGRTYEFEFHHSGKVIVETGDRIFYVTARGNWYPAFGSLSANFDLTFRYPRDLELVTPGDIIEDRTEGDWRITRRRPSAPIGLAGFNLGNYAHSRVSRGQYIVDVCANRALEPALQARQGVPVPMVTPAPARRGAGRTPPVEMAPTPIPADPLARLQTLASDVMSALEFMGSKFGPPPIPHLTVSPIPGQFGQGFPGLIYLSTRSYVSPSETRMQASDALFFDELLQAHETAHQWWGGLVYSASYRDDWLMEALANYSALLYVEKFKGAHEVETLLDSYRTSLLAKGERGQTLDSAGPIVLGTRLESSVEPRAWQVITYGKGSWILQMLRQWMGNDRFSSMLTEVVRRYSRRQLSTEDFRELASQFLPPNSDDPKLETFFDQWVYGTGIPALKLTYSVKGKAPALRLMGTLTQSDVGDDFSVLAPVEIQTGRGQTITRWVRTSNEPASFSMNLKQLPSKVTLDPHFAVLRRL